MFTRREIEDFLEEELVAYDKSPKLFLTNLNKTLRKNNWRVICIREGDLYPLGYRRVESSLKYIEDGQHFKVIT